MSWFDDIGDNVDEGESTKKGPKEDEDEDEVGGGWFSSPSTPSSSSPSSAQKKSELPVCKYLQYFYLYLYLFIILYLLLLYILLDSTDYIFTLVNDILSCVIFLNVLSQFFDNYTDMELIALERTQTTSRTSIIPLLNHILPTRNLILLLLLLFSLPHLLPKKIVGFQWNLLVPNS